MRRWFTTVGNWSDRSFLSSGSFTMSKSLTGFWGSLLIWRHSDVFSPGRGNQRSQPAGEKDPRQKDWLRKVYKNIFTCHSYTSMAAKYIWIKWQNKGITWPKYNLNNCSLKLNQWQVALDSHVSVYGMYRKHRNSLFLIVGQTLKYWNIYICMYFIVLRYS